MADTFVGLSQKRSKAVGRPHYLVTNAEHFFSRLYTTSQKGNRILANLPEVLAPSDLYMIEKVTVSGNQWVTEIHCQNWFEK